MQDREVILGGILYLVTEADGQVIFRCADGMSTTTFALEWTGCGWYLVAANDWYGRVFANHIVKAVRWVEDNYAIEWKDGVGTVSLINS